MHKAVVAHFELAAKDPESLKRFYASLFGWRMRTQDAGGCTVYVIDPNGDGIEGTITPADPGGVRIFVAVVVVLENVYYAEELDGRMSERPHDIACAAGRATVDAFADPQVN